MSQARAPINGTNNIGPYTKRPARSECCAICFTGRSEGSTFFVTENGLAFACLWTKLHETLQGIYLHNFEDYPIQPSTKLQNRWCSSETISPFAKPEWGNQVFIILGTTANFGSSTPNRRQMVELNSS